MKKVFTDTSTIAHLWANQLQDEASNGKYGNFYFNGPSIYSYGSHFVIAKHVNVNEKPAVLFTTASYSNTTRKHIGIVSQASRHLDKIYCRNPRFTDYEANSFHVGNFQAWQNNIESIAASLQNARKPEIYLNKIDREYDQVQKYAEYFGIAIPAALIAAKGITNGAQFLEFNAAKERYAREEKERINKETNKKLQKDLKKWRVFELPRISTRANEDFLRYNSTKERIETSQAVEIPLAIAHTFYKRMLTVISKGGCTDCPDKLMDYSVKQISKDGIIIGCHNISMKEIKRIADLLQW